MSAVYVLDSNNNRVESMTKEEILAAIQTAAEGGNFKGFENMAFVSKLRELNKNAEFGVWVGTQAEYNSIFTKKKNVLYLISDDPLCSDLPNKVENAVKAIDEIELKLAGYDKTEKELKDGFAEIDDDFDEIAKGFEESQKAFEEAQKCCEEIEKKYAADNEIVVLFESVEGKTGSSLNTTENITNFREICIVYDITSTNKAYTGITQQKRFFVGDAESWRYVLDETYPTKDNGVCTTCFVYKTSNTIFYKPTWIDIADYTNDTGSLSCKIFKIYGIGRVE